MKTLKKKESVVFAVQISLWLNLYYVKINIVLDVGKNTSKKNLNMETYFSPVWISVQFHLSSLIASLEYTSQICYHFIANKSA